MLQWILIDRTQAPFYICNRRKRSMGIRINDIAPDFEAPTTEGPVIFHRWLWNQWTVFFSYPGNFSPVSVTEVGMAAELSREFTARNCGLIGLSVDSLETHEALSREIRETRGIPVDFPLIEDTDLRVAALYNMLPVPEADSEGVLRDDARIVRSVFVISPDRRIKFHQYYPVGTGRNFQEILRILDSLRLSTWHRVATPVNWKPGDDVFIPPDLDEEAARAMFPEGWKELKPYMRLIPQPPLARNLR